MAEQKFFKMLWQGVIPPEKIITEIRTGFLIRTKDSEDWIEREWQKAIAGGLKEWPNDRKPTRYRFCGVQERDGKLIIMLDPCVSYRDFAGSCSPEFLERFGEHCNPHPLAVSVVIVVSDPDGQKIMLTVRKNVDYKPGGYHASIGGFMDISKENDIVSAVYREVKEEAGIESNELSDLRCVALAYNPWTLHSDPVFLATTTLSSGEIRKRTKDDENDSLYFISATRRSIEELITKTSHANVVIAMIGLLLVGKALPAQDDEDERPEEWHRRMLLILAEESKNYDLPHVRQELEIRDTAHFQKIIAIAWLTQMVCKKTP